MLATACTSATPAAERADIREVQELARDAGNVLLELSAYDYALAGTLGGGRTYVVDPDRYAAIARGDVDRIRRFTGSALAVTLDAKGPMTDRLVALSDGLTDLAHDVDAYVAGTDPATFASVVGRVARSWEDLIALERLVRPVDAQLSALIDRGRSLTVRVSPRTLYTLTAGPYATADDANAAARRIGTVEQVARTSPFTIRVGTFDDRAKADAANTALAAKSVTGIVTEERRYSFARGDTIPDAELWREPASVFDTWGSARRVAVSTNAAWIATGSDDGTVAIFTGAGTLRSLPKFNAGVAFLAFSEDNKWLMGGGQTLANFILPDGVGVGKQVELPSPALQLVYVPKAYYFAAIARAARGAPGTGGMLAGRAPDGAPLLSFPIGTPSSGGSLAATRAGELYVATDSNAGDTDIEVLDLTRDRTMRGVLRVPGTSKILAVDPGGTLGAILTDKGVYRFGPHSTDPAKTLTRIADPVVDLAFGYDGTLYMLQKTELSAHDLRGELLWKTPLVDARRLVIASRPVVLDGAGELIAFDRKGTLSDLGVSGNVVDVAASPDGGRLAVLTDRSRALVFKLP